jgi:anti-repressor protein
MSAILQSDGRQPVIDALAVITNEAREGVDARQLHAALGIGRDFSTWIRENIDRFGFTEGQDYSPFSGDRSDGLAGKPRAEYALSLNAAKLIALSQNSAAARAARVALVQIEERWNSPDAVMARALQMAHATIARTRHDVQEGLARIAALLPKAELHDRLIAAGGDICLQDAGRSLGHGPNKFIKTLLADRILFRVHRKRMEPFAQYGPAGAGHFRVRLVPVGVDQFGRDKVRHQVLVTPSGLTWLARRYAPGCTPQALIPQEVH